MIPSNKIKSEPLPEEIQKEFNTYEAFIKEGSEKSLTQFTADAKEAVSNFDLPQSYSDFGKILENAFERSDQFSKVEQGYKDEIKAGESRIEELKKGNKNGATEEEKKGFTKVDKEFNALINTNADMFLQFLKTKRDNFQHIIDEARMSGKSVDETKVDREFLDSMKDLHNRNFSDKEIIEKIKKGDLIQYLNPKEAGLTTVRSAVFKELEVLWDARQNLLSTMILPQVDRIKEATSNLNKVIRPKILWQELAKYLKSDDVISTYSSRMTNDETYLDAKNIKQQVKVIDILELNKFINEVNNDSFAQLFLQNKDVKKVFENRRMVQANKKDLGLNQMILRSTIAKKFAEAKDETSMKAWANICKGYFFDNPMPGVTESNQKEEYKKLSDIFVDNMFKALETSKVHIYDVIDLNRKNPRGKGQEENAFAKELISGMAIKYFSSKENQNSFSSKSSFEKNIFLKYLLNCDIFSLGEEQKKILRENGAQVENALNGYIKTIKGKKGREEANDKLKSFKKIMQFELLEKKQPKVEKKATIKEQVKPEEKVMKLKEEKVEQKAKKEPAKPTVEKEAVKPKETAVEKPKEVKKEAVEPKKKEVVKKQMSLEDLEKDIKAKEKQSESLSNELRKLRQNLYSKKISRGKIKGEALELDKEIKAVAKKIDETLEKSRDINSELHKARQMLETSKYGKGPAPTGYQHLTSEVIGILKEKQQNFDTKAKLVKAARQELTNLETNLKKSNPKITPVQIARKKNEQREKIVKLEKEMNQAMDELAKAKKETPKSGVKAATWVRDNGKKMRAKKEQKKESKNEPRKPGQPGQ